MLSINSRRRYYSIALAVGVIIAIAVGIFIPLHYAQPVNWIAAALATGCLLLTQTWQVNTPRRNGRIEAVPTSSMWLIPLIMLAPLSWVMLVAIAAQVVFDLRRRHCIDDFLDATQRLLIVIGIVGVLRTVLESTVGLSMKGGLTVSVLLAYGAISFAYLALTVGLNLIDVSLREAQPLRQVWAEDRDLRLRLYIIFSITAPLVAMASEAFHPYFIVLGMLNNFNVRFVTTLICASEQRASYDQLTGIGNRSMFWSQSEHALRRARSTGEQVGVFMLDVDRFKQINDTLGHEAGDLVLREVARRLSTELGSGVQAFRLGGDEFTLLLSSVRDVQQLADLGQQVLELVSRPMQGAELGLGETSRLVASTSVGIALFPDHADESHLLLKHADIAMYRAKEDRNTVCLYEQREDTSATGDLELLADLHEAVASEQIEVYYQPKLHAPSGRVLGVEALVRWRHPVHGLISPDIFVPIAEHAGLITAMTGQMMRTAIADLRVLHAQGRMLDLSINISAHVLVSAQVRQWIEEIKAEGGMPAEHLILEVNETTMTKHPARMAAVLGELRSYGVRISIDDYGTAASALLRMAELRPDEIKIDSSLIARLDDEVTQAIVASTVALGQTLKMQVVAEGVETSEVAERLQQMGCEVMQGYFFGVPMRRSELQAWLLGREQVSINLMSRHHSTS